MITINSNNTNKTAISKADSWKMFDEISPRYDFLNHFLSLGLDISWRRKLKHYIPNKPNQSLCDLATGTADVLITLTKNNSKIGQATGVDRAAKMLSIGRKKVHKAGLNSRIGLKEADINALPFDDNEFDINTIAFGIRNVENPIKVLMEMYRTLKLGGRSLILEFSLPKNWIMKIFYIFYLRVVVPILGGLLSGNIKAYSYLNKTIEKFYYGENFCRLMRQVGFKDVSYHPLMFGIATIYSGCKE